MIFAGAVIAGAMAAIQEEKAFQERMALLPPELQKKLKDEIISEWEKEKEHRRQIEIAEAGRARNFWGQ